MMRPMGETDGDLDHRWSTWEEPGPSLADVQRVRMDSQSALVWVISNSFTPSFGVPVLSCDIENMYYIIYSMYI